LPLKQDRKKPFAEFCFRQPKRFAIQSLIMRRFHIFCWIGVLFISLLANTFAGEYRLTNGDIYKGEPASFDDEGLIVRLDIGGFSPRISWSKLTQGTLKDLAKDPRAAKFAEAFIEQPPEERQEAKKKKEIVIKPVPRVEHPTKTGLFASWSTPVGISLLVLLFVANIYAAYEIARYRNRPAAVICVVSAFLPVFGPLLFLSMPTLEAGSTLDDQAGPSSPEPVAAEAKKTGKAQSGLGLAAAGEKAKSEGGDQTVYRRGDTTFNRRFFETKFPGFFRVVPSEAEKDLVLVIKGAKSEHLAKRISRISMNEMHIQPLHGGGEVSIPFGEVTEVRVRHKDAK
jgi:hypothetical protein